MNLLASLTNRIFLGSAMLAVLAIAQARRPDGWLLGAVMGSGALGDVLLDIRFEAGVVAFGIGHAVAIALYRRNRRSVSTASQLTSLNSSSASRKMRPPARNSASFSARPSGIGAAARARQKGSVRALRR